MQAGEQPGGGGYGQSAIRLWRGTGVEPPGDGGLRHRATLRRAGTLRRPIDVAGGLAALLGRFLDDAGGDLAELLVAWRWRGLWFGLLLLLSSAFVFVSHGDSLTLMRL